MEGWIEGETQGVVQVSLGLRYLLADHRGNQSLDTDTESRVSKRRGTGSSLFGFCVQQRACYLSKAGWWVGLFSMVITLGNQPLSQLLCFPTLALTQRPFSVCVCLEG